MRTGNCWLACLMFVMLWPLVQPPHALAQPTRVDDADRGIILKEGVGPAEFRYGKCWAIVVGTNYAKQDRTALGHGNLPELQNAEHDARAVAEMLKSNYGFDEVTLLLGKDATQQDILANLSGTIFCNKEKIKENDCVLFYFSGHGSIVKDSSGKLDRGYLLPFDVRVDGETPNSGTSIDIRAQADNMIKNCPARHKLMLLDCCYSGAVFLDGYNTDTEFGKTDLVVFKSPAFQIMTASRPNETAADATRSIATGEAEAHSPFTSALLHAWNSLPRRVPRFTATTLFRSVQLHMDNDRIAAKQRPLCRLLNGQGEFHFLPSPNAKFKEDVDPRKSRAMLLAMVPTTFGNWWVDESPWFMPGLRYEILAERPELRAAEDEINLKLLKTEAFNLKGRYSVEKLNENVQCRFKHLKLLLDADSQDRTQAAMTKIAAELSRLNEAGKLEAPDVHFLATLQHKLGQKDDSGNDKAEATYIAARDAYKQQQEQHPEYRSLEALCLADYGYLQLQVKGRYEQAARNFQDSGRMFDGESPAPFRIFTLCREADAWRRNGNSGLSEDRMQLALGISQLFDKNQTHHLTAALLKQNAWANMEQWCFEEAKDAFLKAKEILHKPLFKDRQEARIDEFHVEHGLAMIERFRGKPIEALKKYRSLTPEIAAHIRLLDFSRGELVDNYSEIRALLVERLVNSLERQGDCNLFADAPDFAEAADDYRRAVRECADLPGDRIRLMLPGLLCKQAIALCLSQDARDVPLAQRLIKEARSVAPRDSKDQPSSVTFLAQVANCIAQCFEEEDCQAKLLGELRDAVQTHRQRFGSFIVRDDLEIMMFATKVLIQRELQLHEGGRLQDRFQLSDDSRLLLEFCRLVQRTEYPAPETLKYLRPYYDAVFAAKIALQPGHAKELIEIAWEATRGTTYNKPETVSPLLVLYHANSQSYVLIDVPARRSKWFRLDEYTLDQIAGATIGKEPLILPDEVRRTMRDLEQLEVRWHDPVLGLGYPSSSGVTVVTVNKIYGDKLMVLMPRADTMFPFDIKRTLPADAHVQSENEDSITFYRKVPKEPVVQPVGGNNPLAVESPNP
jgi:hypothetical protein